MDLAGPPDSVFETALAAEEAFYRALASADVDGMLGVWADIDELWLVHPTGPALRGRAAVHESWRRIFHKARGMQVRTSDRRTTSTGTLAVHHLYENIQMNGARGPREVVVLVTNVYRRFEAGWRMVAHHASPAPAGRSGPAEESPPVIH